MMNEKLVIFDIDGTILDHDKKIVPSTKAAIAELQEKGIQVAIATGRSPFMFEELRNELNISNFVSFNGQLVVMNDEIVYGNPISLELCHEVLVDAVERDYPIIFQNEKEMKVNVRDHVHVAEAMNSLQFDYPEHNVDFYKDVTVYQSLLFCEEGKEAEFKSKYVGQLDFIRWHKYSVDVLPAGGSKAKGIEVLMNKLGVKNENVYAFGDGLNDLEMIQFVGNGIVMGNGVDELKKLANYVTKNVDEDGILHGLKWAGLL